MFFRLFLINIYESDRFLSLIFYIFSMPKCPHCKKEVTFDNLKMKQKGFGFLRQEAMYICPHCDCIIAISRGKYG